MGPELKKMLGDQELGKTIILENSGASYLFNPNTRGLFRFVCQRPCIWPSALCKLSGFSIPTVKWHLEKLHSIELVFTSTQGRRTLYYPSSLISFEHVQIASHLNNQTTRAIVMAIIDEGEVTQRTLESTFGFSQQNLSYHLKKLRGAGLITRTTSKPRRKYRLGNEFKAIYQNILDRRDEFIKHLQNVIIKDTSGLASVKKTKTKFLITLPDNEIWEIPLMPEIFNGFKGRNM